MILEKGPNRPKTEDYLGCRQGAHSDESILVSVEKSPGSFLYIIEEQSETQEDGWNVDASG